MRFKTTLAILSHACASIDPVEFERLVSHCETTIKNGKKIIVSGLGKIVSISEKFVGTLWSLGLEANFMDTNTAIHGDLGMVREEDLVIILSKSGETLESIELVKLLEQRMNTDQLWLISFSRESTLSRKIKNRIVAELLHEGDKWNIVPNNSTTMNLIILQELAMRLADNLQIDLEQFRKNHPGGNIGDRLKHGI